MENKQQKLIDLIVKVTSYLLAFYIFFLLGRTLWINYQLRESINKLYQQIATLEEQKKDLDNLILYYQSDSFKELEARRKLGLKKSDEKVMILPTSTESPASFSEELIKEKEGTKIKKEAKEMPNWRLWWEFFTK